MLYKYAVMNIKVHYTSLILSWCVLRHVNSTQLRPVTQLDLLFGLDKMRESKQATATADPANLREVPLDWKPLTLHAHTLILSLSLLSFCLIFFLLKFFFLVFHICYILNIICLHIYNQILKTVTWCLFIITVIINSIHTKWSFIILEHFNLFKYFCYDQLLFAYCVEADVHFFGYDGEEYELSYIYKCFSNQDQVSWNTEHCLTVLLGCMSITLKLNWMVHVWLSSIPIWPWL